MKRVPPRIFKIFRQSTSQHGRVSHLAWMVGVRTVRGSPIPFGMAYTYQAINQKPMNHGVLPPVDFGAEQITHSQETTFTALGAMKLKHM